MRERSVCESLDRPSLCRSRLVELGDELTDQSLFRRKILSPECVKPNSNFQRVEVCLCSKNRSNIACATAALPLL